MEAVLTMNKPKTISLAHKKAGSEEETRYEKLHLEIVVSSNEGSKAIAREIANAIRVKEFNGEPCVLGLATGSSPIKVYEELIRMHKQEGLSFQNVVTFNLDEYFPMTPEDRNSYVRFMNENLFDHIDIPKQNVNVPDGTIEPEKSKQYCEDYERKIQSYGGLDIQILGIGRTGHIGFNEPGSHINSLTRMVTLDNLTKRDAAPAFQGIKNVPRRALTMGVGTIMQAKRIILMAWGEGKSPVVEKASEGEITSEIPASYLQNHPNATFVVDEGAAMHLTRVQTPWRVGPCQWDEFLTKKAVVWLCKKVQKPILKLTDKDYNDHELGELISAYGSAYELNIQVFKRLQKTITGWPGGKPGADDTNRPERAEPAQKTCLIFSPHPDDDVISMGGTFIRLADQGHNVHVAYQTSGNIAVSDEYVHQFIDFIRETANVLGLDGEKADELYEKVVSSIQNKGVEDIDIPEARMLKGLIRRAEARAGARFAGITDEKTHFLNMPFYETGAVKKNPLGEEDIQIIVDLLQDLKPHQIYAAGDLSDPHGTHRVCLDAIFAALEKLKGEKWMKDCYVWLYRGAWHEWEMENIDMAVPISPDELLKKRFSIFKHQSQKDGVVFPGSDPREFWQRAEDRNKGTAQTFNLLGLPEYEAIEAFKRYIP